MKSSIISGAFRNRMKLHPPLIPPLSALRRIRRGEKGGKQFGPSPLGGEGWVRGAFETITTSSTCFEHKNNLIRLSSSGGSVRPIVGLTRGSMLFSMGMARTRKGRDKGSVIFPWPSIFMLLCLLLASCAHVTLIAPYDERIEKGITELQKDTTAFFVKIERQGGSSKEEYAKHTDFYDKAKVALKSLMIRVEATSQNKLTEHQIRLLRDKYDKLESQHKTIGLTPYTLAPLETSFDDSFRAMLTLEVAKKDLK